VIKSKYFSESDLQRFVSESEQEIDLREVQRAEAHRMQAITDFIANPPTNTSQTPTRWFKRSVPMARVHGELQKWTQSGVLMP
jgi:hypothetical protein